MVSLLIGTAQSLGDTVAGFVLVASLLTTPAGHTGLYFPPLAGLLLCGSLSALCEQAIEAYLGRGKRAVGVLGRKLGTGHVG